MDFKRIAISLAAAVILSTPAFASKSGTVSSGGGGSGGGGSGGSGGTTAVNVLPTTPPAPDVVLRESFGMGDQFGGRPQGDKGDLRSPVSSPGLSGYWLEYPGSKNSPWSASRWMFASCSLNPYETLASPLENGISDGCLYSEWRDGVLAYADALVPLQAPSAKYTVSTEMYPGMLDGAYVGFGLTTSSSLTANLPASGEIWIQLSTAAPYDGLHGQYAVFSGSQVLASGYVAFNGFNPVAITVDPSAQTVTVTYNGTDLGTWSVAVTARFIAFEGQGVADDVVVRTVP
ncbi:MAG: hypothetical protein ACJ78X_16325 [Myxococcales bacterium]